MRIIYRGVDLGVIETHYLSFEPVYSDDGVDYLYTRVTGAVRGIINGQSEVLNPILGRPFNGPPMSYSFGKGYTTEVGTGGSTVELKGGGGKPFLFKGKPGERSLISPAAPLTTTTSDAAAAITGGVGAFPPAIADTIAAASAVTGGLFRADIKGLSFIPPPKEIKPVVKPTTTAASGVPTGTERTAPKTTPPNSDFTTPPSSGIDVRTPSALRTIRRVPNAPPLTHGTIRHRLSVPRGKLYIFSGPGQESGKPKEGTSDPPNENAILLLECPAGKLPCDAKNGPFPQVLSIIEALGDSNTLLVDWAFEAYITEALENDVRPFAALLSNRFSQVHTVAEDSYLTITTTGTAVFRTDFVYSQPLSPDNLRPRLFLPILPGFVRENIQVKGREDVTGVEYSFQDRQVSVNFTAAPYVGAASITAIHRQAVTTRTDISLLAGAEKTVGILLNTKWLMQKDRDTPIGGKAKRPPLPPRLRVPGGGKP